MVQRVRDVMTPSPIGVSVDAPVSEVARMMREEDIDAVLVVEGQQLHGLVTDRDVVVRIVAEASDLRTATAKAACSPTLLTVAPDDDVDRAVALMRQSGVRRLPVVDSGRPVGVVDLGDVAVARGAAALGDISVPADPDE